MKGSIFSLVLPAEQNSHSGVCAGVSDALVLPCWSASSAPFRPLRRPYRCATDPRPTRCSEMRASHPAMFTRAQHNVPPFRFIETAEMPQIVYPVSSVGLPSSDADFAVTGEQRSPMPIAHCSYSGRRKCTCPPSINGPNLPDMEDWLVTARH